MANFQDPKAPFDSAGHNKSAADDDDQSFTSICKKSHGLFLESAKRVLAIQQELYTVYKNCHDKEMCQVHANTLAKEARQCYARTKFHYQNYRAVEVVQGQGRRYIRSSDVKCYMDNIRAVEKKIKGSYQESAIAAPGSPLIHGNANDTFNNIRNDQLRKDALPSGTKEVTFGDDSFLSNGNKSRPKGDGEKVSGHSQVLTSQSLADHVKTNPDPKHVTASGVVNSSASVQPLAEANPITGPQLATALKVTKDQAAKAEAVRRDAVRTKATIAAAEVAAKRLQQEDEDAQRRADAAEQQRLKTEAADLARQEKEAAIRNADLKCLKDEKAKKANKSRREAAEKERLQRDKAERKRREDYDSQSRLAAEAKANLITKTQLAAALKVTKDQAAMAEAESLDHVCKDQRHRKDKSAWLETRVANCCGLQKLWDPGGFFIHRSPTC